MVYNAKLDSDDYFLSADNPAATSDQRDMESLAIRIFNEPALQQARQQAKQRWRGFIGKDAPEEAWARFDQYMGDEWAFQKVMKAVNSDPNYPRVLSNLWAPPHEWFGLKIPGGRAADNPDNNYSFVPISGYASYELWGKCLNADIDAPIQLVANTPMTTTLALLSWDDVKLNEDGTFVVTIGPEPANGRANHIQSTIDAKYLLMRDSRSDWRQYPNAYRIRRIDPPAAPPMTFGQIRDRAANMMLEDVGANYWWMRLWSQLEANVCPQPISTVNIGGMPGQRILQARLDLREDEAYVMTIHHHDARYRGFLLFHPFARVLDCWSSTCSFNNSQSIANDNETTTFVISKNDPGVYNWLDTNGLLKPFLIHRWQGIPADADNDSSPWAQGKLIKLRDARMELPETTRFVTPEERQQQLAERRETFNLRFKDH